MKNFILMLVLTACGFVGGVWFAGSSFMSQGGHSVVDVNQEQIIIGTLARQSAAWSAGDIDRFMQDYWRTDDLRFASGGTVKRGWQTTYDRYVARYPDKATMGSLAFTDLEVEVLSNTHALVFGRWTLTRDGDAPTGLFTLHMEKQGDAWKIVSDHTSSATP